MVIENLKIDDLANLLAASTTLITLLKSFTPSEDITNWRPSKNKSSATVLSKKFLSVVGVLLIFFPIILIVSYVFSCVNSKEVECYLSITLTIFMIIHFFVYIDEYHSVPLKFRVKAESKYLSATLKKIEGFVFCLPFSTAYCFAFYMIIPECEWLLCFTVILLMGIEVLLLLLLSNKSKCKYKYATIYCGEKEIEKVETDSIKKKGKWLIAYSVKEKKEYRILAKELKQIEYYDLNKDLV